MDGGKFVGGSALAKKRARQSKFKRPQAAQHGKQNNRTKSHNPLRIPRKVRSSDRFFASLLLSPFEELIHSNNASNWMQCMSNIVQRAGVPFPAKLHSNDVDSNDFFLMRASLVLEEARSIIVESLQKIQRRRSESDCIDVNLISVDKRKDGFSTLTFEKKSKYNQGSEAFTPSEMYDFKPGCVLQISFRDHSGYMRHVLANIQAMANVDNQSVSLVVYRLKDMDGYLNEDTSFHLSPITTLISEQRQFVGCYDRPNCSFLTKLMGMKGATHVRFDDSDDSDDEKDMEEKSDDDIEEGHSEEKKDEYEEEDVENFGQDEDVIPLCSISIPSLNISQEKAATSFINGPSHNLSLVQGPPGTGKTTFMTAVLCRTFLVNYVPNKDIFRIDRNKRILVAAPTNKAISVLCLRFMQATKGYMGLNVILIGVEDALFPKDEDTESLRSMRGIFVYTWVDELLNDFSTLKFNERGIPTLEMIEEVLSCARFLTQKITSSIPQSSEKFGVLKSSKQYLTLLENLPHVLINEDGEQEDVLRHVHTVNHSLTEVLVKLKSLNTEGSVVEELLATANIIFSTLTSSGVSAMKRTRGIHELYVDEAAATTEAELCIPLHLRPRRMLAVGDPNQLPASVTSQKAVDFGFDKSLLDRLMFGCGGDHNMLDTQYRMNPAISKFPNKTFYDGKLRNGENVKSLLYKSDVPIMGPEPYLFVNISGVEQREGHRSGSYFNLQEAKAIVSLVKKLKEESLSRNIQHWGAIERIRILTFYTGQVRAIRHELGSQGLQHIHVATVDSSQGSESDVIIVSFVRSRSDNGKIGFLQDNRRINVAITRAKHKLFCIGNAQTLENSGVATVQSLVNDARSRNILITGKASCSPQAHLHRAPPLAASSEDEKSSSPESPPAQGLFARLLPSVFSFRRSCDSDVDCADGTSASASTEGTDGCTNTGRTATAKRRASSKASTNHAASRSVRFASILCEMREFPKTEPGVAKRWWLDESLGDLPKKSAEMSPPSCGLMKATSSSLREPLGSGYVIVEGRIRRYSHRLHQKALKEASKSI